LTSVIDDEVVTLPLVSDIHVSTLPISDGNEVLTLDEFHCQESLSPVSPQEVMPLYTYSASRTSTPLPETSLLKAASPIPDDSFIHVSKLLYLKERQGIKNILFEK